MGRSEPLPSARHRGVTVNRDYEGISELAGGFEVAQVAEMEQVKDTVGQDEGFTRPAQLLPPGLGLRQRPKWAHRTQKFEFARISIPAAPTRPNSATTRGVSRPNRYCCTSPLIP
ncbi:MAG: hypothetical protein KatS3mg061_1622 [Dehalococcoidia bacterium]|nr:MAG: hypothetical protein KatS3mg061_1622 [Dehalococcoidia bacterium]